MSKTRFVNQKLGKRTSRKADMLKARLESQQRHLLAAPHKRGPSREAKPHLAH